MLFNDVSSPRVSQQHFHSLETTSTHWGQLHNLVTLRHSRVIFGVFEVCIPYAGMHKNG